MRRRTLLHVLLAIAALTAWSAGATASRLSLNRSSVGINWTELTFSGGGMAVTCPLALEAAFHSSTIVKTVGSLVARVVEANMPGRCTGDGSATILRATLPWHLAYGGFVGRLPGITGITLSIVGLSMRFDFGGIVCLVATSTTEPARVIARVGAGGVVTSVAADATATIDLSGGFLCELAGDSTFSGTAAAKGDAKDLATGDNTADQFRTMPPPDSDFFKPGLELTVTLV